MQMHLIKDHILRKVNKETVLVPYSGRETDFDGMIVLNETGELICKLLEKETSEEELVLALANEYEQDKNAVEQDVRTFLNQLSECHLLVGWGEA